MTVPHLLQRFVAIGMDQDKALLRGEHEKFNRLFDEMVAIEEELKIRDGDQRKELLDLYDHPNAQVRLTPSRQRSRSHPSSHYTCSKLSPNLANTRKRGMRE
jgi:hypothetical protein